MLRRGPNTSFSIHCNNASPFLRYNHRTKMNPLATLLYTRDSLINQTPTASPKPPISKPSKVLPSNPLSLKALPPEKNTHIRSRFPTRHSVLKLPKCRSFKLSDHSYISVRSYHNPRALVLSSISPCSFGLLATWTINPVSLYYLIIPRRSKSTNLPTA